MYYTCTHTDLMYDHNYTRVRTVRKKKHPNIIAIASLLRVAHCF